MADAIDTYFDALDLSSVVRERAVVLQQALQTICPEQISTAFVSDYRTDDDVRVYESLWFFSRNFVMEAKNFLTVDDLDIARIATSIIYLRITRDKYEFDAVSSPASRLTAQALLANGVRLDYKATSDNCGHLYSIVREWLLPNMVIA